MNSIATQEFRQVQGIIALRRSQALQAVNNENLLTAWEAGAFVSARLKNSVWGSKTVKQLSEYLRTRDPSLRGYSSRSIYKMVAFYEAYSSETAPTMAVQIAPPMVAQFPNFLNLTTLTKVCNAAQKQIFVLKQKKKYLCPVLINKKIYYGPNGSNKRRT